LSLVEAGHPSAFDRADVHEDILASVIRLDKSEALLAVEPLHGSLCHITHSLRYVRRKAAQQRSRFRFEIWGGHQSVARWGAGQVIRPKLVTFNVGFGGLYRKITFNGALIARSTPRPPQLEPLQRRTDRQHLSAETLMELMCRSDGGKAEHPKVPAVSA
jgi:hypothetical protein